MLETRFSFFRLNLYFTMQVQLQSQDRFFEGTLAKVAATQFHNQILQTLKVDEQKHI